MAQLADIAALRRSTAVLLGGAVVGCLAWSAFEFALRAHPNQHSRPAIPARLSAAPSDAMLAAARGGPIPFETLAVRSIEQQGCLTATVHVALADAKHSNAPARFTDGRRPGTNITWGALYGVETHLANSGTWTRLWSDEGDGQAVLRRVLFYRRVEPGAAWQARGIDEPFDFFVLAQAWSAEHIAEAMEQPVREAICGEVTTMTLDGRVLGFGGLSLLTGYLGPNHLQEQFRDLLAGSEGCRNDRQVGVFYLCSKSAAPLHMPLVQRGAYPVLFAKSAITAEGYTLDGLLAAVAEGEFGDGFIRWTAAEYARFQRQVAEETAASLFIR